MKLKNTVTLKEGRGKGVGGGGGAESLRQFMGSYVTESHQSIRKERKKECLGVFRVDSQKSMLWSFDFSKIDLRA